MKCSKCNYDGVMTDNKCPKCNSMVHDQSFLEDEIKRCAEEAEIIIKKREEQNAAQTTAKSDNKIQPTKRVTNNQMIFVLALICTALISVNANSTLFAIVFLGGIFVILIAAFGDAVKKDAAKKISSPHNVPKCPTCGSENIERISITEKVFFAGPFAPLYKTFRCNNCKHKW